MQQLVEKDEVEAQIMEEMPRPAKRQQGVANAIQQHIPPEFVKHKR